MTVTLTFREFMIVCAPGGLFALITWALHYPLILRWLPVTNSSGCFKILAFIVVSVTVGATVESLCDVLVTLTTKRVGTEPWYLRGAKWAIKPFFFIEYEDPRVSAFNGYVESRMRGRNQQLFDMVGTWADMTGADLAVDENKIVAHQHVVVHLKSLGEHSHQMEREMWQTMRYSGSLFLALAALQPLSILAVFTGPGSWAVRLSIALGIYAAAVVLAYVFVRRTREYFARVLTLGLHCYMVSRQSAACKEQTASGSEQHIEASSDTPAKIG